MKMQELQEKNMKECKIKLWIIVIKCGNITINYEMLFIMIDDEMQILQCKYNTMYKIN